MIGGHGPFKGRESFRLEGSGAEDCKASRVFSRLEYARDFPLRKGKQGGKSTSRQGPFSLTCSSLYLNSGYVSDFKPSRKDENGFMYSVRDEALLYMIELCRLVFNSRYLVHFSSIPACHIVISVYMNCKYVRSYEPMQSLGRESRERVLMIGSLPALRHRCHLSHKVAHDPCGYTNP